MGGHKRRWDDGYGQSSPFYCGIDGCEVCLAFRRAYPGPQGEQHFPDLCNCGKADCPNCAPIIGQHHR